MSSHTFTCEMHVVCQFNPARPLQQQLLVEILRLGCHFVLLYYSLSNARFRCRVYRVRAPGTSNSKGVHERIRLVCCDHSYLSTELALLVGHYLTRLEHPRASSGGPPRSKAERPLLFVSPNGVKSGASHHANRFVFSPDN